MRFSLLSILALSAAVATASLHPSRDTQRHRTRALARSVLPSGWSLHSACVIDHVEPQRLLSTRLVSTSLTPAMCTAQCQAKGFSYAGVEYGKECWCGSSLKTSNVAGAKVNATQCSTTCAGDSNQKCGGGWRMALYAHASTSNHVASSVAASSTPAAATTVLASSAAASASATPAPSTGSSKYKLTDNYSGTSFFDNWSFFTSADPTNGNVNYQSQMNATEQGLAYVGSDGVAVMKVDNTNWVNSGNRNSVRIASKKTFNQGLFVYDIIGAPYGCSVWPAMWQVGPNWPEGGELDIMEYVNSGKNQITMHTGSSTTCSINSVAASDVTGSFMGKTCASSENSNSGCAFQDTGAYGSNFNGAIYAALIDSDGVKVWRFSPSSVPSDISNGAPVPTAWGTPMATFPSTSGCKTSDVLKQQQIVFDITLCGGWASSDYPTSGCPGTCASQIADPKNFDNAIWKIKSVKVYQ